MKRPPPQLGNLSHKGSSVASVVRSKTALGEAATFSINFKKATPPSRTYSAESCYIQYRNDEVYFIFAQHSLVEEALETAISIRMHGFFANFFLESVRAMSNPGLAEIARKHEISAETLGKISMEPKHLAKLSGNIIQAAVSGHEVALDFYQVSPLAVMKVKESGQKGDIELTPVARVEMRTSLFLGLFDELSSLQSKFPLPPKDMLEISRESN